MNGDDTPTWSYNLTVPAGGTVTVLNFVAGLGSRADAALKAAQLAALPPWARVCMTSTEASTLSQLRVLAAADRTGADRSRPA